MSIDHQPLPEDHRRRLVALMAAWNAGRASSAMGISRQTFDRAIGGLPLHPWTLAKVAKKIEERNAAGKVP